MWQKGHILIYCWSFLFWLAFCKWWCLTRWFWRKQEAIACVTLPPKFLFVHCYPSWKVLRCCFIFPESMQTWTEKFAYSLVLVSFKAHFNCSPILPPLHVAPVTFKYCPPSLDDSNLAPMMSSVLLSSRPQQLLEQKQPIRWCICLQYEGLKAARSVIADW